MGRQPRVENEALREALRQLLPLMAPIFEKEVFQYAIWDQVQQTHEYKQCVEVMRQNKAISRHLDVLLGTRRSRSHHEGSTYIANFFDRVFQEKRENYNGALEKVYPEFERFFYLDDFEVEVICPLISFSWEVEEIELADGVWIKSLPSDLRDKFHRSPIDQFSWVDLWQQIETKFCLHSVVQERKIFGTASPKKQNSTTTAQEKMRLVLGCLRLFQAGEIGSPFIMERIRGWTPTHRWRSCSPASISPYPPAHPTYTIETTKVDEFLHFYRWCWGAIDKAGRDVKWAIQRFNSSYEKPNSEDALVDLVIALESLFLLGGERGEYAYRLGMRVAGLLEFVGEERHKTFEFVVSAYKQRSNVVHGQEVPRKVGLGKEGHIAFGQFVTRLEDYVRRCIRHILEMNLSRKEERIKVLEGRILNRPGND